VLLVTLLRRVYIIQISNSNLATLVGGENQRLAALVAGIEFGSVDERAGIMALAGRVDGRSLARTLSNFLVQ